jgi:hypothetical protein
MWYFHLTNIHTVGIKDPLPAATSLRSKIARRQMIFMVEFETSPKITGRISDPHVV